MWPAVLVLVLQPNVLLEGALRRVRLIAFLIVAAMVSLNHIVCAANTFGSSGLTTVGFMKALLVA